MQNENVINQMGTEVCYEIRTNNKTHQQYSIVKYFIRNGVKHLGRTIRREKK